MRAVPRLHGTGHRRAHGRRGDEGNARSVRVRAIDQRERHRPDEVSVRLRFVLWRDLPQCRWHDLRALRFMEAPEELAGVGDRRAHQGNEGSAGTASGLSSQQGRAGREATGSNALHQARGDPRTGPALHTSARLGGESYGELCALPHDWQRAAILAPSAAQADAGEPHLSLPRARDHRPHPCLRGDRQGGERGTGVDHVKGRTEGWR